VMSCQSGKARSRDACRGKLCQIISTVEDIVVILTDKCGNVNFPKLKDAFGVADWDEFHPMY